MIDVDRLDYASSFIITGLLTKRVITTDDDKYVFKANKGFFTQDESPTSFGEVLFSRICQELGCNCVKADFAHMHIEGTPCNGAVTKYYWDEDTLEAVTFRDITKRLRMRYINADDDMVVGNIVALTSASAKIWGLDFDAKKTEKDLNKLAVLDYFLAQTDRHPDNIEFLIEENNIKMAPYYDNGFCFNLWCMQNKLDEIPKSKYEHGSPQFLRLFDERVRLDARIGNLANQIARVVKDDEELATFVSRMYNLDLTRILKSVYNESAKDFDKIYLKNCQQIFDYRKDTLKQELRREGALDKVQKASKGTQSVGTISSPWADDCQIMR